MSNKNKQNKRPSDDSERSDQNVNDTHTSETVLPGKQKDLKHNAQSLTKWEAELNKRQIELDEKELQARNEFPKLFEEKYADFKKKLEEREDKCVNEWKSIEEEKENLRQRELLIKKSESQIEGDYSDLRTQLEKELDEMRKKADEELSKKREEQFEKLENEIQAEREKRLKLLTQEIDSKRSESENYIKFKTDELKNKEDMLRERERSLESLELEKEKAQRSKERYDEERDAIEGEIERGITERRNSFEKEKAALTNEIDRLRESINTSGALISNFEELKHKLGDEDPADVLRKLKTYEEDIKELREDLATRPTQEMQKKFDGLKSDNSALKKACERLSEENETLKAAARKQSELEGQIKTLEMEKKSCEQRFESVDAQNNKLMEDLKRLQASYEREQDREARIRDIEAPYIQKELSRATEVVKEIEWLENISKSCIDYGLRFPRRILHAFHTALKTSEWSPITILAGVSGTGKSELPRLYSHFGGINFLSLSVQPNWDSQESMLGFFNSIDNKFDSQPVLRLLAQTQKEISKEYPFGLEDVMSLILMDEMNLAHVELYFAEFLSKLELRRGMKNDPPFLDVKLGAGILPYQLPIGRNVLWAGTMNQDETTKSLSDKVLDRGIVINFPRPTTLERRRQLKPLGQQAPLLSRKLWESWWCRESKFNNEILPFKGFIEEMNKSLSKVGRALGHRVWQSIEYYMSNHPEVMEAQRNNDDAGLNKAMKTAFEDQLVQKVMPKLRGIETRGKSKSDCLDNILKQLVNDDYTIINDFNQACEFGYGQFIWNSADYLKDDIQVDAANPNSEKTNAEESPSKVKEKKRK